MTQPVTLSTAGSIAVIEINNPPVNALSQAVRQGLLDAVVQADADAAVTAIVILGAGRSFPAGDISRSLANRCRIRICRM